MSVETKKAGMEIELSTSQGSPLPFGTSFSDSDVNFSVFSKSATSMTLALYYPDEHLPFQSINLNPLTNKTGDVWHVLVHSVPHNIHYCYFADGPDDIMQGHIFDSKNALIDPRAHLLSQSTHWGSKDLYLRNILQAPLSFDWKDDAHPNHPLEEMIIYEMHVRGFTQDPSSHTKNPGTFLGVIEKIPYLKALGVTAVELLPIHPFNECEYPKTNPVTGAPLYNYWGYSTINFFSPMNRYAVIRENTIIEFKTMVAALHAEGIEVILDVVFNHTAEGNEKGPTLSFKGFENSIYYMLSQGEYLNYSGCGNTFNCNYPAVRDLILDSLRYWVAEMRVDGFRFDLATILGRAQDGTPLANPPLLESIALDPVLGKTKLIAEAWDAGGLYQVGSFPSWGVWAEWNGKYRDNVRDFIKGTDNTVGLFATRLCGSPDLYASSRTPGHSVNFLTAHDGFTLMDLVSYNDKHNEENGENNQDGTNQNDSWNCGVEGSTNDKSILSLRNRQVKNFITALMVSQGTPMICMGDEIGQSKKGNNNTWCHDSDLNWLSWINGHLEAEIFRFMSLMIQLRKKHTLLKRGIFLTDRDIKWHGKKPYEPNWNPDSRFIAYTLIDQVLENNLYIAFNAGYETAQVNVPYPPYSKTWYKIVDTAAASPEDFTPPKSAKPLETLEIAMIPHSAIILKAL
ncbi:MAG: isoamylase [Chlamydiales bacterium]|nr:isoamylase [Chlamydiales bacterium]